MILRNALQVQARLFSNSCSRLGSNSKRKGKGDTMLVMIQSTVTGHTMQANRARQGEKMETLAFDPLIQKKVLYRESRKIRTYSSKDSDKYTRATKIEYPPHFDVS